MDVEREFRRANRADPMRSQADHDEMRVPNPACKPQYPAHTGQAETLAAELSADFFCRVARDHPQADLFAALFHAQAE